MSQKPILRPYAQYTLGLAMALQRATGGNTTYFLGEVSNLGWKTYFPIVYLIKEPLAFHILSLIALFCAVFLIKRPFWINIFPHLKIWLQNHFPEFSMFVFIVIYWATSLTSTLNIGVRHLLPVLPFTILLISALTSQWLKEPYLKLKTLLLALLISWQAVSIISIYPHFLAYFNELAGSADNGYNYVVDSNLDWGQDLKRLTKWIEENKIDKIYVDYFGGGEAKFYLKEKFREWHGNFSPNDLPKGSYLAISATFLQNGRGKPVADFNQPTGFYRWLDKYTPVEKIGYSIFIYHIK
jgi:hypothetical protein